MDSLNAKIKKLARQHSALRIIIFSLNTVVLLLLAIHHFNTGTHGFAFSLKILEDALNKESEPGFKELNLRKNCEYDETVIPLYYWPGIYKGCLCYKQSNPDFSKVTDFHFLDTSCYKKAVHCYGTKKHETKKARQLLKYANGLSFCAKK